MKHAVLICNMSSHDYMFQGMHVTATEGKHAQLCGAPAASHTLCARGENQAWSSQTPGQIQNQVPHSCVHVAGMHVVDTICSCTMMSGVYAHLRVLRAPSSDG
jgi:hypothetical protein